MKAAASIVVGLVATLSASPLPAQSILKPQGSLGPLAPKVQQFEQKPAFEVFCRGGRLMRLEPAGARLGLFFSHSAVLPGADGSSLAEGTCSPGARLFAGTDPPGIEFGSVSELGSLKSAVTDPSRYFRFVVSEGTGMFVARDYRSWQVQPASPPATKPAELSTTTPPNPAEKAGLNPQPLPPKDGGLKPDEKAAIPNPTGKSALNQQPLPPKVPPTDEPVPSSAGTQPAGGQASTAVAGSTATPASDRGIIIVGGKEAVAQSNTAPDAGHSSAPSTKVNAPGPAHVPVRPPSPRDVSGANIAIQGQGSRIGRNEGALEKRRVEILCRGGAALRVERLDVESSAAGFVVMGVYFTKPAAAAGSLGTHLQPGTCSPRGNEVFGERDPSGIQFEVAGNARHKAMLSSGVGPLSTAAERFPDAESVPVYLADANHYWRFVAVDTGRGHFRAIAHQHWKVGNDRLAGEAGDIRRNAVAALIRNVTVAADVRSVRFDFIAPADAQPRVMIVKGPLTPGPNGTTQSVGAPMHLRSERGQDASAGTASVRYFADSRVHRIPTQGDTELEPGTPYHYFIHDTKDDSGWRVEGDFRTLVDPRSRVTEAGTSLAASDADTTVVAERRKHRPETDAELQRPGRPPMTVSAKPRAPIEIPNASTPLIDASERMADAPIQEQMPGRVADLKVDCTTNGPRISHISGQVSPGTPFTISGMCFGPEAGTVEIIGAGLKADFQEWTDTAIVAVVRSPVTGVNDRSIAITVRRAADRKRSAAKAASFVATRERLEVPPNLWQPTAHFKSRNVSEGGYDLFEGYDAGGFPQRPTTSAFRVAVNPECALDGVAATVSEGRVDRIDGWEDGPPHEANVRITWTPRCVIRRSQHATGHSRESTCEVEFALRATAYCPAGIKP